MKDNTTSRLVQELSRLLEEYRPVFRQRRTYWRCMGLVLAEVLNFGRHTMTQDILSLGVEQGDWSAWYRLFSHKRFEMQELWSKLLGQTLEHVTEDEPYVVALDSTTIHRSSLKMPGSSWMRDSRFSAFRPGIHRAQRFLHAAWLTPAENGYSRAVPIQFESAFPQKAVPAEEPVRREWEAALAALRWLRMELDTLGRAGQRVLALADGSFDVAGLWSSLPEKVTLVVRTARNRCLFWLPKPEAHPGPGRPPSYGERAPKPADWLHAGLRQWPSLLVQVRGKCIRMRYQILGPFLRDGLPDQPLFLIVVKGIHRQQGSRYRHRDPSFYLVNALLREGTWQLPYPAEQLLPWLWQRWEIEVAHREMKSGLGLGEKQCWNGRSAVVSLQWTAWVYALCLLAGYRSWGLCSGPPTPARWWPGAKRWSFSTLWRAFRSAFWTSPEFRPACTTTPNDWWKKEAWIANLTHSALSSSRI